MSCCIRLDNVEDWYDWEGAQPDEPSGLISLAQLGGGIEPIRAAKKVRVTDFASQTWAATPLSLLNQPICLALGGDKAINTANAQQWMFDHKTWNDSTTLPESLKKVMFMRGGPQWRMVINISISGIVGMDVFQLAFRDNAGTRGDYAGTYPVLQWESTTGGGYLGNISLRVDLRKLGRYSMVLWTKSKPTGTPAAPVYSMMEMEWIVVP